jgi:hypothetical protein
MVMRKLAAVEEARAVMTEGMEWGVWKWLLEKRRVQEIADRATAALHEADRKVKASWSDELKTAYKELVEQEKPKRGRRQEKDPEGVNIAPEVRLTAKKVKQAYDEGQRARVDAEDTFEEAERRMSTDLAREGARKALESYDLRACHSQSGSSRWADHIRRQSVMRHKPLSDRAPERVYRQLSTCNTIPPFSRRK